MNPSSSSSSSSPIRSELLSHSMYQTPPTQQEMPFLL
uniref:Uncharacterized protein n=1 Tax=Rhizophora mucronata TaxID=61149 RepID=A0A2P2JEK3_RHIMU